MRNYLGEFARHYQCDMKEYPAPWRFLGGVWWKLKPPITTINPVFIHQLEHCILAFLRGVADGVEALKCWFNWVGPYFLIIVLKQLANLLGFALKHCGLVSNTNLL